MPAHTDPTAPSLEPATDPRPPAADPPPAASEAATLLGFLDFLREAVARKAEGLDDDALRATLPPSTITLGGLLAHLAFVEDYWLGHVASGREPVEPWRSTDWAADEDADWRLGEALGSRARELWTEQVRRSRDLTATLLAGDEERALATTHPRGEGAEVSLRYVLVHLVEEYGRHAGHADLVRESIDGVRGE